MKKAIILTLAVLFMVGSTLAFAGGEKEAAASAKKPWQMIQWDNPMPAAQRLAAREYVLPEGWKEATKGVEYIVHFNAGAMQHDPGTLANFKLFEKLTGIKVRYVEVSDNVLLEKTISALVSRDPNITSACVSEPAFAMQHLVVAGWLENMNSIWGPEVQKLYAPGLLNLLKGPDGNFYGTVDTQKAAFVYVRPSWLKAAGVTKMPETWAEIREASKKAREWAVKNLDSTYYGMGFCGDHYILQIMQGLTYSQGGRLMDKNGKVNLMTPEFKNTWNTLVDMIKVDKSAPEAILGWTWNDYQQAFAMGKLAIIINALNTNRVLYGDATKSPGVQKDVFGNTVQGGDWLALPMPKWDASKPENLKGSSPINLSAMVINRYASDNAKAAAMILGEVRMSYQGGLNELLLEGNTPFMSKALADPEVLKQVKYTDVEQIANTNAVLEVFPPGGERVMDILMERYGAAVTGKMSNDAALKAAQEEVDALQTYQVVK